MDDTGTTPVLDAVHKAEVLLAATEKTKTYLPIAGAPSYTTVATELIFGGDFASARQGRIAAAQSLGGTGALRLGFELLKLARPAAAVWIPTPTWGNHPAILRAVGLESWAKIWLGTKETALWAVFVPTLWQYVGYHMLLLYAGVKSVPPELREAAMLDGATDGQVNRYIVLPYIKPIIRISVIFAVTGSLKSFDLIYVLTNGGPLHATEVPSTLMINMLFLRNRYGMGSTIAVMLIVLCFGFALLISAIFREEK